MNVARLYPVDLLPEVSPELEAEWRALDLDEGCINALVQAGYSSTEDVKARLKWDDICALPGVHAQRYSMIMDAFRIAPPKAAEVPYNPAAFIESEAAMEKRLRREILMDQWCELGLDWLCCSALADKYTSTAAVKRLTYNDILDLYDIGKVRARQICKAFNITIPPDPKTMQIHRAAAAIVEHLWARHDIELTQEDAIKVAERVLDAAKGKS